MRLDVFKKLVLNLRLSPKIWEEKGQILESKTHSLFALLNCLQLSGALRLFNPFLLILASFPSEEIELLHLVLASLFRTFLNNSYNFIIWGKSSNSILPSALINEMCSSSHNKSICLALFAVIGVIALTNVADASANHALMEMRTILDDGFDAAHDQVKGDEKHKHPRLQSGVHRTLGKMIALGYALKSTWVNFDWIELILFD